jgi:hypothetical protein
MVPMDGWGATRPGLDGSRDGRAELCLSIAFALHTILVGVAVVRSLAPPAARVVRVEHTVDVDVEQRAVMKAVEPVIEPPVPPPSPSHAHASGSVVDPDDPFAGAKPVGAAPVEAARIVTVEGPGDRPAFASGNAAGPSYGFVSADGTGTDPTFDPYHGGGGKGQRAGRGWARPGEVGNGDPGPPSADRSRPASLIGAYTDKCPFPPESDKAGIDHAVVLLSVTVRPDGKAHEAHVLSEPGYGFGREAMRCGLVQGYIPALDAEGKPIWTPSLLVRIRFTR